MRAKGMQVLTNQIAATYPGVVIYGIGDKAHQLQVSGHNEDDTAGVRAEDQDADSTPEHRAIDVMIGPAFSPADADALVAALVGQELDRKARGLPRRLLYLNWGNWQWSYSSGWVRRDNSDDPHPDHVHISGEADADENTTPWNLTGSSTMTDLDYGNVWPTPNIAENRPAKLMIAEIWSELHLGQGAYGGDGFVLRQLARIEDAVKSAPVELAPDQLEQISNAVTAALAAKLDASIQAALIAVLNKTGLKVG